MNFKNMNQDEKAYIKRVMYQFSSEALAESIAEECERQKPLGLRDSHINVNDYCYECGIFPKYAITICLRKLFREPQLVKFCHICYGKRISRKIEV